LICFSAVQALVLAIIVNAWCRPPASFAPQFGLLLGLAAAGVALGLAISAVAPTEELAITLIPMAIIPQILLSGVIAPLSGLSKHLARWLSTAYWGNRGLSALLPQEKLRQVGMEQGAAAESGLVVLAHAVVFVLFAVAVLYWQGRRSGLGKLLRRGKATTA
jgi:ABC transport system ATP-binding/permease protein